MEGPLDFFLDDDLFDDRFEDREDSKGTAGHLSTGGFLSTSTGSTRFPSSSSSLGASAIGSASELYISGYEQSANSFSAQPTTTTYRGGNTSAGRSSSTFTSPSKHTRSEKTGEHRRRAPSRGGAFGEDTSSSRDFYYRESSVQLFEPSSSSSSSSSAETSGNTAPEVLLVHGGVTYLRDPEDPRSSDFLKEQLTTQLAPDVDEEDLTMPGSVELETTGASLFLSGSFGSSSGYDSTAQTQGYRPLRINDRVAANTNTANTTQETTTHGNNSGPGTSPSSVDPLAPSTGGGGFFGDNNCNNLLSQNGTIQIDIDALHGSRRSNLSNTSAISSIVDTLSNATGASTSKKDDGDDFSSRPKSLVIDEAKLLGVQAPDGTSFLAYFGGYRSEFDRITNRILKKRFESQQRAPRRISPATFFNVEHQSDGVLIDQMSDLEVLYSRHQILFLCLLSLDFLVMTMYLRLMYHNGMELWGLKGADDEVMRQVFWGIFFAQFTFAMCYYALGVLACRGAHITKYEWMGRFSVATIVGLVLIIVAEYVRKFNLFLFFLRLVMHLYSKFLVTLNQHFFLSNSGRDVYQLLATTGVDDDDDEDDEYSETRQALMDIHRREAAEAV
ncbi:unnamed protein product [Amoebophrya sp. A25]|nr:unnamed protein product [Amoebophrya sp. A25]|eukprot:GSA25T00008486001.1